MSARPLLARLSISLAAVAGSIAVGVGGGAGPASAATSGFDCARVPTVPVAVGASERISARLDGASATYGARRTSSTTVPVPGVGLPYPGTLTVTDSGGTQTLTRPPGFAGSAVVQLCLVSDAIDGGPAVLLGGYTGGAHCCFLSALYARVNGRYWTSTQANLHTITVGLGYDLNQGLVPKDVDGRTVIESADGDFAYRFGCFACTPTPVHLYAVSGEELIDVTPNNPAFVERSAASLWDAVRQNETAASQYDGLFGALAAWTAEECEIHRGAAAWTRVEALDRSGLLSDAHYHAAVFVTTGSYVPTLRTFLLAHGYCAGQIPGG